MHKVKLITKVVTLSYCVKKKKTSFLIFDTVKPSLHPKILKKYIFALVAIASKF